MSLISDNQKNLIFDNAVAREFKLPNIFIDDQLFANILYRVYQVYMHCYKRFFIKASIFLNNRTTYLDDVNILYIFNKLESIFHCVNLKNNLNTRQKFLLKALRDKNISAWRSIAL